MRPASQLDRFVAAVHRRAVGVFVLERVGAAAGMVAAITVLALLVATLSLDRTLPWTPIFLWTAMGLFLGVYYGWQRRPTRLAAVIEADRQLKLDDLLSSAMTAHDDDFGRTVRALAEQACESLSPSAVVVRRFGGRAWGGIGLAWAVVLVLGLLTAGQSDSLAGDEAIQAIVPAGRDVPGGQPLVQSNAPHLPGEGTGVDEPRDFGDAPGQADPNRPGASPADQNTPGQASTGAGGGTASTDTARVETPGTGATAAGSTADTGETAGGTGVARPGTGQGVTGGTAARPADRAAAPWRSDQWPAARAAALQAVQDGRVSDEYRDVVRAYFDAAPQ